MDTINILFCVTPRLQLRYNCYVTQLDSVLNTQKQITKTFVLGQFDYRNDCAFVQVESQYSNKTLYLQKEVYQAFLHMYEAASQDGVHLKIISGTRNFNEQKSIWNANGMHTRTSLLLNVQKKFYDIVLCLEPQDTIGVQIWT